jgi:TRAP-type C4-dicarboxylate transport system permease small subunit
MSMSYSRNQHLTVDAALSKSTPEVRSLAMWAFILVVAIVAIAALVWDGSGSR